MLAGAAAAARDGEVAAGSMGSSGGWSRRRKQGRDERSKEQEVDALRHCSDVS